MISNFLKNVKQQFNGLDEIVNYAAQTYILDGGIYFVNDKGLIKYFYIDKKFNKETKKMENIIKDEDNNLIQENNELIEKIKYLELFSLTPYKSSNKALERKTLYTINIYGLIYKIKNTDKKIDEMYEKNVIPGGVLFDVIEVTKKKKEIENVRHYLKNKFNIVFDKENRAKESKKILDFQKKVVQFVKENKENLIDNYYDYLSKPVSKATKEEIWIKSFATLDIEKAKSDFISWMVATGGSSAKYIYTNHQMVFTTNDYSNTYNDKKPFLKTKTRQQNEIPYYMESEEYIKNYLLIGSIDLNKPLVSIDKNHYYLLQNKKGLMEFEILPSKNFNIEPIPFVWIDYFKKDGDVIKFLKTTEFISFLDKKLFDFALTEFAFKPVNFKDNARLKKLPQSKEKEFMVMAIKDIVVSYLKGVNNDLTKLYKVLLKHKHFWLKMYLKESTELYKQYKIKDILNLMMSFKNFTEGEVMNLELLNQHIQEILDSNISLTELDDKQQSFLLGQLIYYLLSQKNSDKTGDMISPFLQIKNVQKLKKEIKMLYKLYGYDLKLSYKRLNRALSYVYALNEGELKIDEDMLLAGIFYTNNNIFYKSNKGEEK